MYKHRRLAYGPGYSEPTNSVIFKQSSKELYHTLENGLVAVAHIQDALGTEQVRPPGLQELPQPGVHALGVERALPLQSHRRHPCVVPVAMAASRLVVVVLVLAIRFIALVIVMEPIPFRFPRLQCAKRSAALFTWVTLLRSQF